MQRKLVRAGYLPRYNRYPGRVRAGRVHLRYVRLKYPGTSAYPGRLPPNYLGVMGMSGMLPFGPFEIPGYARYTGIGTFEITVYIGYVAPSKYPGMPGMSGVRLPKYLCEIRNTRVCGLGYYTLKNPHSYPDDPWNR